MTESIINKNDYTNIQSIIEGCLLGDGHISRRKPTYNGSFSYRSSSIQHVEYIHEFFKEYCTENYQTIKRSETYDKRTNKTYVSYYFRTKCMEIFTIFHDRFYIDKIKIVPKDLQINNINLLFLYIGDGELESKHGHIKLHTNLFTIKEVQFLSELLYKYNARSTKKTLNQYIIYIPRKKVNEFLKYIGKCPFTDYEHKWDQVPYKNKNIEVSGINNYDNLYDKIVNEYNTIKTSIYKLHKKYNIPINCIKNHFNNNDIRWQPTKTNKEILQMDFNGNTIKEWESGQEIKRVLNYNSSAISECCRGIRKTYKKCLWKFK
jgi:hypothetical protein